MYTSPSLSLAPSGRTKPEPLASSSTTPSTLRGAASLGGAAASAATASSPGSASRARPRRRRERLLRVAGSSERPCQDRLDEVRLAQATIAVDAERGGEGVEVSEWAYLEVLGIDDRHVELPS